MSIDQRLVELLLRWEEGRAQGQPVTPEELCRNSPELLKPLRRRIADLQQVDGLLETKLEEEDSSATAGPAARALVRSGEALAAHAAPVELHVRYENLRFHAEGGMGEVWQAIDADLGRRVALKFIQDRYRDDSQATQRFRVEAELTSKLDHPGIAPVHSVGRMPDGRPCYSMRFIQGQSFRDAISRFHEPSREGSEVQEILQARGADFSSLAFRELLQRFIAVCNTIAYAHSRGVIHRDLKPANIMLGKYGETLVVDWGLARLVERDEKARATAEETLKPSTAEDDGSTRTGLAKGTPAYMSPEQAAGNWDAVHNASDIYSLGATLYEVLTCRPPFERASWPEMQQRIQRGEFPRPRHVSRAIPAGLEAVCLKAMATNPTQRYETALELAGELEHWLGDEPLAAHVEPVVARIRRWTRKHPGAVSATAATVLLAVIGLLAGWIVLGEKNRALDQLNTNLQASLDRETSERQRAVANEKTANENDVITQAVLDFLEKKVLAAARPKDQEGGLGYDVKLADAVKSALPFVEESFPNQPLIEARLRMTLGTSFWLLGERQIAVRQMEKARALCTQHRGPDHADTLRTIGNIAASYAALGRLAESLQLTEETLALRKAKLGPGHADTIMNMMNLANVYAEFSQHAEAVKLYEETLALMKARFGPEHPHTLMIMSNMTRGYTELGRHAEAHKLCEEALALRKAKLGPDHPDTLSSMSNLANSYDAAGRTQEALKLNEKTLQLTKAKLGPDHPDTLSSMSNLASSYDAAGRTREALKLHEETFQLKKAKLGPEHPHTLTSMNNVASSYFAAGRAQEALKLYEETLQLRRVKLGPDHLDTLTSMNNMALSYAAVGRSQEALQLFEETLLLRKAKLGPHHRHTLGSMNNLASSYADAGRAQEALKLREETLQLTKAKLGPHHPDTLRSMMGLGSSYAAAGRMPEALKLKEESLQLMKAKLGPDHPNTIISMFNLGNSYVDIKNYSGAEDLLLGCQSAVASGRPGIHPGIRRDVVPALIELYDAWGKPAEAEKWLVKLPAQQKVRLGLERHHAWPLLWGWPRF